MTARLRRLPSASLRVASHRARCARFEPGFSSFSFRIYEKTPLSRGCSYLAEREGFEPSMGLLTPYSLSRGAPSATRPSLRKLIVSCPRPARRALLRNARERDGLRTFGACPPLPLRVVPAASRPPHRARAARFEPSMGLLTPYSLSRGAPSATRPSLRKLIVSCPRPARRALLRNARERDGLRTFGACPPLPLRVVPAASRPPHRARAARFEPSMGLLTPYSLSRGAPSATRPSLRKLIVLCARPARRRCCTFDPSELAIIPMQSRFWPVIRLPEAPDFCDNTRWWSSSVSPRH